MQSSRQADHADHRKRWGMKFVKCIWPLIMLAGIQQPLQAHTQVQFTVQTQNVLRFGHGRRLADQCNELTTISSDVDLIVMQEVMSSGYPCLSAYNKKGVNLQLPPHFDYATSDGKGRSSYIEYYGSLYRTGGSNVELRQTGAKYDPNDYTSFSRPPYAIQFEVRDTAAGTKCDLWVVNFHAIFGKTIAGRRAEATAMGTIYQTLVGMNSGAVLMFGDWNLAANDSGFDWVAMQNTAIFPDVETSLTRAGAPSSKYDHIVRPTGSTIATQVLPPAAPTRWTYPAPTQLVTWRKDISDHMGVRTKVEVTC